MINHNAPVGMKIIWRAPVQCRDIKWWFDVPLLIDIASQFLHKRPQSKLFACRPSFRSTPLLRMISCDNIMPMICVNFEKQIAEENSFHLNFLKFIFCWCPYSSLLAQIPQPKSSGWGWWLWERADSKRLREAEKSFCLQLEASLKVGGKLKWVPLDELQARSIIGDSIHSWAAQCIWASIDFNSSPPLIPPLSQPLSQPPTARSGH